ncbi:unnamed protein product [Gulo gulo]|uniref:Uncharacterized protein n=1 Tax=Gulo gulo TaxID=48420 RepID=A0A9X9LRA2_GULGU|nr:unnamed protein product [Gulo gulo]
MASRSLRLSGGSWNRIELGELEIPVGQQERCEAGDFPGGLVGGGVASGLR